MLQVKCRSNEVGRREKESVGHAGQISRPLSASTASSATGEGCEITAMNTVRGPSCNRYPTPLYIPPPSDL